MAKDTCRWGILSTAAIAKKNWKAIANSGNGTITAVASRTRERSHAFIDELQSHVPFAPEPAAFGSYQDLIESDSVDAVYIPLPTGVRKEWVIRAARAGKHVLSEKPCGDTVADVEEMTAACREAGVQFMDGVMFMHSRRLPALREVLDDGQSIGQLRRISIGFSFFAPEDFHDHNIRVSSQLESMGALGDLGWYCARFALFARNYELPDKVIGRVLHEFGRKDSPTSVPMEFSGELFWSDGVSASFYASFMAEHQQWVVLSGTRGYARVEGFVLPYHGADVGFEVCNHAFECLGPDFNMRRGLRYIPVPEYGNSFADSQEANLFRAFATLVNSGRTEPFWPEVSIKTQRILNACLESARNDSRPVSL